jgi:uncharacterized protein with LGFP repeats
LLFLYTNLFLLIVCILAYSSLASFPFFIEESDARCKNGYHKSPSGDCEKVTDTKGMPRYPDGFHRSPDGDCESVSGNKDEEEEDEEDDNDDFSDSSSESKKSTEDDDTPFFFPDSTESEVNSNQDTVSQENDIDLTNNVESSNFQENSIPSNIIDDIMRKHQQFAYTLGNPTSDIQPTIDSKGYYQKFTNGHIFWHPQFGAHEIHSGISDKWNNLGGEKGALGYPISDEHDIDGGRQSDFEKGHITWLAENGEVTVFTNR